MPKNIKRYIVYGVIGLFGVLIVGGISGLSYLTITQKKVKRYEPTGLNQVFHGEGMTFDEYVVDTRRRVAQARKKAGVAKADQKLEETIITLNSPFQWRPKSLAPDQEGAKTKYKNGVLLMHGLGGSVFEMRSLAQYFLARGFLVRTTLMPGHGTVPGDLTNVDYTEWLKMAEYGIESFKGQVDNLYLVGFSTGGALAAYKAVEQAKNGTNRIAGIILTSPALDIKVSFAYLSNTANAISKIFTGIKMIVQAPDNNFAQYESFPINGGAQIYNLVSEFQAKRDEAPIQVPIFSVSSMADRAVNVKNVKEYLYGIENTKNAHIFFSPVPVAAPKSLARIRQINSSETAWGGRVVGYSHGALHVSPEDFYYGRYGEYKACTHYKEGSKEQEKCLNGNKYLSAEFPSCGRFFREPERKKHCEETKAFVGESSGENLSKYKPLQQLTYNASYQYIEGELDRFLYNIGALDPYRYQFLEYNRQKDAQGVTERIPTLLRAKYPNGDLKSTLEEISTKDDLKLVQNLFLNDTNVTDLSSVSQLINLRTLLISDVPDKTKKMIPALGGGVPMGKKTLKNIAPLINLEFLEELHIAGIGIGPEDVEAIKKLKQLKVLGLNGTGLTLKDYHEIKEALPDCDIKYLNQVYSYEGPFGVLMKRSGGDLDKTLTVLSKFMDISKISWVTIDSMVVKNVKALKRLPNLNRLSLFEVDVDSYAPLFELGHLEHISVGRVRSPQGGTQELIEGIRTKHPDVVVNSTLDVYLVAKELSLKYGKRGITFDDVLAHHQKDVHPNEVTQLVLADNALNGIRKSRPGIVEYFRDLSGLKKYKNITKVTAQGSSFQDLTAFAGMKKLEQIDIRNSALESLEGLQKVPNLQKLDVRDTKVSDLAPLKGHEKLKFLYIDGTLVASFDPLQKLPELFKLTAKNTRVTDLSPLAELKNLGTLDMGNTPVSDLSPLRGLTFRVLFMYNTNVNDIRPVILHGRNGPMYFDNTPFSALSKKYQIRLYM